MVPVCIIVALVDNKERLYIYLKKIRIILQEISEQEKEQHDCNNILYLN